MLKSMTGYGRHEEMIGGKKISVEIKSVNHRYSDYGIRVPRHLGFLEEKIRNHASEVITRGKVDIFVNIDFYKTADKDIILNEELAEKYIAALHELRDKFGLRDDISVMQISRFPDIFKDERVEDDADEVWQEVKTVMDRSLADFTAMREREGARIEKDLRERIQYMKKLTGEIEERSPQTVREYEEKLYNKIKEILEDRAADEARVLTEVAIFADKVAVNEETVRLGSHFEEFISILESNEPAGRRLDFLIQEINRETNTIGSKVSDVKIAKTVVTLKGEIEKLREQIQNIE